MNIITDTQWGLVLTATVALLMPPACLQAAEREKPYKGYTGTVHQFGFIGGMYSTANPNFAGADGETQVFRDWGQGATYTMHDYVTRQFTFDVITSVTVITAKYLEDNGSSSRQKIVWPVDCRVLRRISRLTLVQDCSGT